MSSYLSLSILVGMCVCARARTCVCVCACVCVCMCVRVPCSPQCVELKRLRTLAYGSGNWNSFMYCSLVSNKLRTVRAPYALEGKRKSLKTVTHRKKQAGMRWIVFIGVVIGYWVHWISFSVSYLSNFREPGVILCSLLRAGTKLGRAPRNCSGSRQRKKSSGQVSTQLFHWTIWWNILLKLFWNVPAIRCHIPRTHLELGLPVIGFLDNAGMCIRGHFRWLAFINMDMNSVKVEKEEFRKRI